MNNITHRLRFYALITLLMLIFSSSILLILYYEKNQHEIKENYITTLNNEFLITMENYSEMADLFYALHINNRDIRKLFAQGVLAKTATQQDLYRQELYSRLKPMYEKLLLYNFRQLHFHTQANISFLRFHRPSKYGDDLTEIRHTVRFVNQERTFTSGFEEGRILNGYRFIYPLSYKGNHTGSVEISVSMNTIIDKLKKVFTRETQFILLKRVVKAKVFESEQTNYKEWWIDNNYVLDNAINGQCILKGTLNAKDIQKIREALAKYSPEGKPFCLQISINDTKNALIFLPVKNFDGIPVAYIFALAADEKIKNQTIAFVIPFCSLVFLFISFLIFIIYYHYNQQKIEDMVSHDYLTRVLTRRIIFKILDSEYKRYKRYKTPFSVLMIDIDHFKSINDQFNHATGDVVLTALAAVLKNGIRSTDYIGRYGGEEFLIILSETTKEAAISAAELLRKRISSFDFHRVGTVTISCGVAIISDDFTSPKELVDNADKKLYQAKELGRNRVVS